VEDQIFKVPRPIFAKSEVIQGLLSGETCLGSEAAPLVLDDVKVEDFFIFMRGALEK
jgi:hypothetical protein